MVRLLSSTWDRGTSMRSASEIERELEPPRRHPGGFQRPGFRPDCRPFSARYLCRRAGGVSRAVDRAELPGRRGGARAGRSIARSRYHKGEPLPVRHAAVFAPVLRLASIQPPVHRHARGACPRCRATTWPSSTKACCARQNAVHVVVGDITADAVLSRWHQLGAARRFPSPLLRWRLRCRGCPRGARRRPR